MASTTCKICLLPGDGIGPEIIAEAVKLLEAVGEAYDVEFSFDEQLIGGCAIDATRAAGQTPTALPEATWLRPVRPTPCCSPPWAAPSGTTPLPARHVRSRAFAIRKQLGLYLNLRPVRIYEALRGASPLKPELLEGVDILIVRELTGGIYFGAHERTADVEGAGVDGAAGTFCRDQMDYSEYEIERVVRWAFDAAARRPRHRLHSVDKANVLEPAACGAR